MRVSNPSCAGTVLKKSGCSDKEVRVGCTGPEGDASEDDFLNSLAIPSVSVWSSMGRCDRWGDEIVWR